MRVVKFRGKCIMNNKWIVGCLVYNLDPTIEIDTIKQAFIRKPIAHLANFEEVYPKTIGQFIEKKDIKGQDIYDGDIVKYRDLKCHGDVSFGTAFVIYEEGEIRLHVISCDIYKDGSIIYMMDELEIIGNIHENPELL